MLYLYFCRAVRVDCPASLYKEKTDYLHPKATQMIEAFDKANQLLNDEVLALPEE